MKPAPSVTIFTKGMEAPCIRFALTDGPWLVLPYIHAGSFELGTGETLLICHFGETQLQIEGERLFSLLLDLQRNTVESVEATAFPEPGLPHVSRIVRVEPGKEFGGAELEEHQF
ncbi:MAG: hypothetical protein V4726_00080 [Verrucomicrobiota bacterium]